MLHLTHTIDGMRLREKQKQSFFGKLGHRNICVYGEFRELGKYSQLCTHVQKRCENLSLANLFACANRK